MVSQAKLMNNYISWDKVKQERYDATLMLWLRVSLEPKYAQICINLVQ